MRSDGELCAPDAHAPVLAAQSAPGGLKIRSANPSTARGWRPRYDQTNPKNPFQIQCLMSKQPLEMGDITLFPAH